MNAEEPVELGGVARQECDIGGDFHRLILLAPALPGSRERVVLVAARLGKARLIDNLRVLR